MALAVLAAGFLRAWLPAQLRVGSRWLLLVIVVVFLGVLIIGDPGRIDRDRPWLRVLTDCMLGVITVANASSGVVLAADIVNGSAFTSNGKVLVRSRCRRSPARPHRAAPSPGPPAATPASGH